MTDLLVFSWSFDRALEEIHAWGLDSDGRPHLIRIKGLTYRLLVRVDESVPASLWNFIRDKVFDEQPVMKGRMRRSLYYYGEPMKMVEMTFSRYETFMTAISKLKTGFTWSVDGKKKKFQFELFDHKVPIERVFLTEKGVTFSGWTRFVDTRPEDEPIAGPGVVELQLDLDDGGDVEPIESNEPSWPLIASFDIEAYSSNHRSFPDGHKADDVIFVISIVSQRYLQPETIRKKALVLGDCDPIDGVELEFFDDENQLLQGFCRYIGEVNPDIITGYNTIQFDFSYINQRISAHGAPGWQTSFTRRRDRLVEFVYRVNEKKQVPQDIFGRVHIDMYKVVKTLHANLPSFKLDHVAEYFLGRKKIDVSPEEMFSVYRRHSESSRAMRRATVPGTDIRGDDLVFHSYVHPDVVAEAKRRYVDSRREMARVVDYCVNDAQLVIELFEKMKMWVTLVQFASVSGVNMEDYFLKGTQHRGFSLIYDLGHRNGYALPEPPVYPKDKYSGAIVVDPVRGIHDDVGVLDFASMYPSSIIAKNICYTTFVRGDVDVPTITIDGHRFVCKEVQEGILPQLMKKLISERNEVKRMERDETDPILKDTYNKRQLALKIMANSMYGLMGVSGQWGMLPLREAAGCVTATGRQLIESAVKIIQKEYNVQIIYGDTDSVMFKIPGVTGKELVRVGQEMERRSREMFGDSILRMEFEKAGTILCITKKCYAFWFMDLSTGRLLPIDQDGAVKNVGGVMARKKTCGWVRRFYGTVQRMALLREDHRVVLNYIFEMVTNLIRGENINLDEFVLRERVGTSYKSKNAPMKLFAEHLTEIGKPPEHGDMLSYVVCDIEGTTAVGQRFRDLDEFRLGGYRLDYLYYMKVACNPIDKLWATAYPCVDSKYSAPISAVQRTFMKSSKVNYQQVIKEWKDVFGC